MKAPPLECVISGGQTGADQGGLRAAEAFGLETGGWAPAAFMTENGPEPSLGDRYGLQETVSSGYIMRTFKNVENADGTIRFATDFSSAGEVCTLNAIEDYEKPYIDVEVDIEWSDKADFDKVIKWIIDNNITVLNVAGHRETKCPGIGLFVETFMTEVFKQLRGRTQ